MKNWKKNEQISIDGVVYTMDSPLKGRGQESPGAFFKDASGKRFVIKASSPEVLAEALIITPGETGTPIIKSEAKVTDKGQIVSIQPAFTPKEATGTTKGFDQFLYLHKRIARLPINEDFIFAKVIRYKIGKMSLETQKELAMAIYISQLNGDESIHTAQFMIATNKKGELTQINRVDFGAAHRSAVNREEHNQFDILHASQSYRKSSLQLKKDYVSYLITSKQVRQELQKLWAETEVKASVHLMKNEFDIQMQNLGILDENKKINTQDTPLTLEQKREVLINFYSILNKDSSSKEEVSDLPLETLYNTVKAKLANSTETRCTKMKAQAQELIRNEGKDSTDFFRAQIESLRAMFRKSKPENNEGKTPRSTSDK